ncbi:histidine triad nucleotide-binding protein [Chitinimonas koreensis]|uniref:histidine triad nucleotide-binding protein n=1 Tax=Chitinimonas koreensis TaxID=356302 RepID=UPI0004204811|nr:histidine triad nucleotide-binding protein [Chitinimonas koreensis]QNM96300.1 histidine triad nucleotide-binding protein [Chitinimonas koreensis]
MSGCIFCRIAQGEIPAKKVYEDDEFIAFHDINPVANVHFLIVPKRHIESLLEVAPGDEALLGRALALAPRLAREQGLGEGFRTMINTGAKGGQSVFHLHLHVFGGGGKAEAAMAQVMQ